MNTVHHFFLGCQKIVSRKICRYKEFYLSSNNLSFKRIVGIFLPSVCYPSAILFRSDPSAIPLPSVHLRRHAGINVTCDGTQ